MAAPNRFAMRAATTMQIIVAALVAAAPASGGDDDRRALVLAKALSYERRLLETKGSSVGIALFYSAADAGSRESAERWAAAFVALGAIKVYDVRLEIVTAAYEPMAAAALVRERGIDVVLACAGVDPGSVSALARKQSVLSAADERTGVERGLSLGVFVKDGKPHIVINMGAARSEGARFSAKLLQLAEVI